jgi:lipopolysaccharide exporter
MLAAAHTLTPFDIGLYAIVNVILGLANIFVAGGLTQGIISRREITSDQLSSLFWFNLLSGVFLGVVVELSAPLIAIFYDQPKLLAMLMVAALNLVIAPLGQTSQAVLQKDLNFAALGRIGIFANILNCVGVVVLLYAGMGVYSLIVSQLISTAVRAALLRIWCPGLARIRLEFHFAQIRPIVNFGLFQTGSGFLYYLSSRLDQFLIAALLGPQALGYYALAWALVMEPVSRISPVIISVAFPVFARRQDDRGALSRGFRLVTKMLAMAIAPMVFGFAAVAPIAIPIALGDRWIPSVRLMELLSVIAIVNAVNAPIGSLVLAMGRADRLFYWTLCYCLVQAPLYAVSLGIGGLVPATVVLCAVHVGATYLVYVYLLRPVLGISISDHMQSFLPATVVAIGMAISVRALSMLPIGSMTGLLVAQIVLGILLYGGATILFRRGDMNQLASLVLSREAPKSGRQSI